MSNVEHAAMPVSTFGNGDPSASTPARPLSPSKQSNNRRSSKRDKKLTAKGEKYIAEQETLKLKKEVSLARVLSALSTLNKFTGKAGEVDCGSIKAGQKIGLNTFTLSDRVHDLDGKLAGLLQDGIAITIKPSIEIAFPSTNLRRSPAHRRLEHEVLKDIKPHSMHDVQVTITLTKRLPLEARDGSTDSLVDSYEGLLVIFRERIQNSQNDEYNRPRSKEVIPVVCRFTRFVWGAKKKDACAELARDHARSLNPKEETMVSRVVGYFFIDAQAESGTRRVSRHCLVLTRAR